MSDPSSSVAGPSATPEVPLAIEPVHIYHSPPPSQPHRPSPLDLFDREPTLHDITPSGRNIFPPRKPAAAQLSEDVLRLWSERGDFSRFRTSSLLAKRPHSPSSSSGDDDDDRPRPALEQQDELTREGDEKIGGTIAESEFVKLRNTVLGNLDVAHFNSIHAHQLLGMLIKQHRSTLPSNTLAAGGGGKMGSPAASVSGQSARSGSTNTAAPAVTKAPLGIFGHLNAQKAEEEFILDPLAISLSRTSLNPTTTRKREIAEEDEEEEFDVDPTSAEYALKQASKEQESAPGYRENQLKEFKVVLETKRKAMESAAELLSAAAGELRSGQGANRERWRGLIGLYGRGWGVTPGRPLLDVERFGVAGGGDDDDDGEVVEGGAEEGEEEVKGKKKGGKGKEGKREKATAAGLQGFGTPIITSDGKVKEEGARDAWIGFGLPEAPIELRRRSLAYWADLPSMPSNPGGLTAEEVKRKLVFPDRMHRRLRVRFVLWPPSSNGKHQQDDRIEWSSDPIPSKQEAAPVGPGQILDQELQQASREATDELVFGDVVAQARLLPPTFGVRLTSTSVRIVLTKRLDCVVELVPTGGQTEDSPQQEAEDGEPSREARYAPHAALLLAFLRMGPLRKYHAFVSATQQARKPDAAARASAIKAAALSVPKKSNAGGSADASAASKAEAGGGKGGAAAAGGGRSTSAALCKLDSVGPVLVGLHYWSFVHRLGSVLRDVQEKALQRGLKVSIQLVPLTVASTTGGSPSLAHLTSTLAQMFDSTASHPYPTTPNTEGNAAATNIHSIYTSPDQTTLSALKGHAKIFVATQSGAAVSKGNRLVCTCSFGQPSLLSIQFAGGKVGKGATLTNKPLAVDLDTLAELVEKQLGQFV
ncbi:hypothetical protein PHBOTO_005105 [Pseudozyma hubeiensis]|nr:hypothetical protein PHBOTO_005105 [Pseudozyma hubeiensis]